MTLPVVQNGLTFEVVQLSFGSCPNNQSEFIVPVIQCNDYYGAVISDQRLNVHECIESYCNYFIFKASVNLRAQSVLYNCIFRRVL